MVACNTASAQALASLRKQLKIPVLGVIEPGAQAAVNTSRNNKIAVLGTQGTIESHAYVKAITKRKKNAQVFQQACPLFVPLVEEGFADKPAAKLIAQEYLKPIKTSGADTVVLGCTHYPILKNLIAQILGPHVALVDSADTLACATKQFLQDQNMAVTTGRGHVKLYASDAPDKFTHAAKKLLGEKMAKATLKKV